MIAIGRPKSVPAVSLVLVLDAPIVGAPSGQCWDLIESPGWSPGDRTAMDFSGKHGPAGLFQLGRSWQSHLMNN